MAATHIDRLRYSLSEASAFLQVHPSTLRWWLEGGKSGGKSYPPVLREEPIGASEMTWYEFMEAGWLREYRRHLNLRRLRPLISSLREQFQVLHPLATVQPFVVGSRDLVYKFQEELDIPQELWIVVGSGQLVLKEESDAFFKRVHFNPSTGAFQAYVLMQPDEPETDAPVMLDPGRAFGIPTIRGIRAEIISELYEAGEPEEFIIDLYSGNGITSSDIRTAVDFERNYLRRAA